MSLIKFIKSADNNKEVDLYLDSSGRIRITFRSAEDIPYNDILYGGFIELNEHNYFEQSDFSNMKYLHRKIDDITYVLTKEENDIYIEPEISEGNNPSFIPDKHEPTINEIRNTKISHLSFICNQHIIDGIDIEIEGGIEHFSYTEEDQVNIKELFDLSVKTNTPLYYHSNGNSCKLYSVEKIIELYTKAAMNKMHHITYFNQLKMYINTLNDIETINLIEYGIELTGDYLNTYNAAMAQAKIGMKTLLKVE